MKALSVDWIKNIKDPSEKKDMEAVIRGATVPLRRLKELVEEYTSEINSLETKMDAYESPSWAYRQAHLNGRKQELKRLKDLLSFVN